MRISREREQRKDFEFLSHRCSFICHPGPCSPQDQCKKKIKVNHELCTIMTPVNFVQITRSVAPASEGRRNSVAIKAWG